MKLPGTEHSQLWVCPSMAFCSPPAGTLRPPLSVPQASQSSSAVSRHRQAAKSLSFQMPTPPPPSCYHFLRFPRQIVCPIKLCVNCVTIRITCVYFQMNWRFWLPCLSVTKSSIFFKKREGRKWKTTTESEEKGHSSLMQELGEVEPPPSQPSPQPL